MIRGNSASQLASFEAPLAASLDKALKIEGLIRNDSIHVSQSTFIARLAERIHRWFRLTPSFGPGLVNEMIDQLRVQKDELILDPFAGAGTTLIEAKLRGFRSVGFEINPLLHFVNRVSLDWEVDVDQLRRSLSAIKLSFDKRAHIRFEDLERAGLKLPPIHNPTRWWRPDVLAHLLVLKQAINSAPDTDRDFFFLCLAGVLIPDLTNVTLGRLQLHFIDRSSDKIDVFGTFARHAQTMLNDVEAVHETEGFGRSDCLFQDSLRLNGLQIAPKVDAVITSPPYPNRYSYVWNTRPYLYFLDFFSTAKEASDLDRKTIGGTWGTATSELTKGAYAPVNSAVEDAVGPTVALIRSSDPLMANYVMHYFNRLAAQIMEMDRILSDKARIAYVVGNSWIKGVYIETDVLLARIVQNIGINFEMSDIHRFRRRHSGDKLYESIVYAWKRG